MTVNVLLCDDSNTDMKSEKKFIEKAFSELNIDYILDCIYDSNSFDIGNKTYDMAFLDVELAESDGFDVARKILRYNKNCIIMFITNHSVYLDKAFDINAFRFFQKPLEYKRLYKGIENAIKRMVAEYAKIEITNHINNRIMEIALNRIIYIENSDRHTKIITEKYEFIARENFAYIKKLISQRADFFISPHSSLFVNYKYIRYYDKYSVSLTKDENIIKLDISRRYYSDFVDKFFRLAEGEI